MYELLVVSYDYFNEYITKIEQIIVQFAIKLIELIISCKILSAPYLVKARCILQFLVCDYVLYGSMY